MAVREVQQKSIRHFVCRACSLQSQETGEQSATIDSRTMTVMLGRLQRWIDDGIICWQDGLMIVLLAAAAGDRLGVWQMCWQ